MKKALSILQVFFKLNVNTGTDKREHWNFQYYKCFLNSLEALSCGTGVIALSILQVFFKLGMLLHFIKVLFSLSILQVFFKPTSFTHPSSNTSSRLSILQVFFKLATKTELFGWVTTKAFNTTSVF